MRAPLGAIRSQGLAGPEKGGAKCRRLGTVVAPGLGMSFQNPEKPLECARLHVLGNRPAPLGNLQEAFQTSLPLHRGQLF